MIDGSAGGYGDRVSSSCGICTSSVGEGGTIQGSKRHSKAAANHGVVFVP